MYAVQVPDRLSEALRLHYFVAFIILSFRWFRKVLFADRTYAFSTCFFSFLLVETPWSLKWIFLSLLRTAKPVSLLLLFRWGDFVLFLIITRILSERAISCFGFQDCFLPLFIARISSVWMFSCQDRILFRLRWETHATRGVCFRCSLSRLFPYAKRLTVGGMRFRFLQKAFRRMFRLNFSFSSSSLLLRFVSVSF